MLEAVTATYLFSPDFLDDHTPRTSTVGRAMAIRALAESADDQGHVRALRSDDIREAQRALGVLIDTYTDRLTRFAYSLVGSVDVAEDVVQDVFVRVWNARARLRPDLSWRGYIFTAVRRRALDVLKHRVVETRNAVKLASAEPMTMTVEDDLDADQMARIVRDAIATLPERRRTVLRLRYEDGLPYADIADVMGVSEKAAKDLAARAIRELRTRLGV